MSKMLNIDEKIKEVEKERDMTEADFDALIDTTKKLIEEGKLEAEICNIMKTYTKAIRDLNRELNYLFKYKGEATNK